MFLNNNQTFFATKNPIGMNYRFNPEMNFIWLIT